MLALPTNFEISKLSEKILPDGSSSINTTLGFDSEMFMPLTTNYKNLNVDKDKDLKLICRLEMKGEEKCFDRTVLSKIVKLVEGNEYAFSMTKQLLEGYFDRKREKKATIYKFNFSI